MSLMTSATGGMPAAPTLATFLVVLARMVGFIIIAPFFGSLNIPMPIRVAMAAVLTVAITPIVAADTGPAVIEASRGTFSFLLVLVNQVLVGLVLGLIGAFVFFGIEAAGRIIDTQRGSNMQDIVAPQTGQRTSPSGQWLMMVALMVLLTSGQHMVMLQAVIDSFDTFRPTGSLAWVGSPETGFEGSTAWKIAELSGESLMITVRVAAPAMISLMLADVLLGIINRGAPQVNVFALSQVVKGPIGIGGLLVALGTNVAYLERGAIKSILEGENSIGAVTQIMSGG